MVFVGFGVIRRAGGPVSRRFPFNPKESAGFAAFLTDRRVRRHAQLGRDGSKSVMDQMSGLTTIGKVGLSWLSLELVKGQASGQGVIRRGKTTRITSVPYSSIGHSSPLIAHETPTASCACGSHLNFAECGMARAFAGSYRNSRLRRPPPTLRFTARLISPDLGSLSEAWYVGPTACARQSPISSPRPRFEFCFQTSHSRSFSLSGCC